MKICFLCTHPIEKGFTYKFYRPLPGKTEEDICNNFESNIERGEICEVCIKDFHEFYEYNSKKK